MTSPIPTDNERRLHIAVIAVAAVVAVAMVAAAAWSLTRPRPVRELPTGTFTPAQETSASATTTGGIASRTSTPTQATSSSSESTHAQASQESTRGTVIIDAHKIAYRIARALFVANEDGTGARAAYGTSSAYALSPDGLNVASIEGGELAVVGVGRRPASKADLTPGTPAEDVTPVWTPDSSGVLFVRTDKQGVPSVWRYILSAGTSVRVGPGSGMAVSPDGGTTVALPIEATDSPVLAVWRSDGRAYAITVPSGDPVAVALANDRIYVSTMSSAGAAALWSLSLDGKQRKQLAGASSAGSTSATYGQLLLSPDGHRLLYTVESDDGYSRILVVPVGGGSPVAISKRRDGYPLKWTADGKHILFIEGNAYQGQTTALWRSDLTGHQRKELVKQANL